MPADACVAVLRTDYLSSAITFADCDGRLLTPSWIDSGTVVGTLSTSLSGDVTLVAPPSGLGWLDRYNVDVLTVAFDDATFAQHDLRGEATGTSPNPHDAVWLDDGRVLVTRYGGAPGPDGGTVNDDLVVLEDGAIVQRIEPMVRMTVDGRTIYARPDELELLGNPPSVAVVTLGRATGIYDAFAEGMLAAISIGDHPDVTALVPLPGLQNCGVLERDPLDATRAYVSCSGPLREPSEVRRALAGVVEIEVHDGVLSVSDVLRIEAPHPVPSAGLLSLGERRVLVVGTGSAGLTDVRDEILEASFSDRTVRSVHTSTGSFGIGRGTLVSPARALIPDATTSEILVLETSAPALVVERVLVDDCIELPPRGLLAL